MKAAQLRKDAGQILATSREAKALTQAQVGKALGVNQSTYSRLEKRPGSAHAQTLLSALAYFGLKIEDVLED